MAFLRTLHLGPELVRRPVELFRYIVDIGALYGRTPLRGSRLTRSRLIERNDRVPILVCQRVPLHVDHVAPQLFRRGPYSKAPLRRRHDGGRVILGDGTFTALFRVLVGRLLVLTSEIILDQVVSQRLVAFLGLRDLCLDFRPALAGHAVRRCVYVLGRLLQRLLIRLVVVYACGVALPGGALSCLLPQHARLGAELIG